MILALERLQDINGLVLPIISQYLIDNVNAGM